jgi:hypothetical protein
MHPRNDDAGGPKVTGVERVIRQGLAMIGSRRHGVTAVRALIWPWPWNEL